MLNLNTMPSTGGRPGPDSARLDRSFSKQLNGTDARKEVSGATPMIWNAGDNALLHANNNLLSGIPPLLIHATSATRCSGSSDDSGLFEHYTDSPFALPQDDLSLEGLERFAREGVFGSPQEIANAIYHPETIGYFIGESHQGPPLPAVVALIDILQREGRDVTVGFEYGASAELEEIVGDLFDSGTGNRELTEEERYDNELRFIERFVNYILGTPSPEWGPYQIQGWEQARQVLINVNIPPFIAASRIGADFLLFESPDRNERDEQGNYIVNRDKEMFRAAEEWRNNGNEDNVILYLTGGAHSLQCRAEEPRLDFIPQINLDVDYPFAARKLSELDLSDDRYKVFYFAPAPALDSHGNTTSAPEALLHLLSPTPEDTHGIFPVETYPGSRTNAPAIVPLDENGIPVPDALDLMRREWTQPRSPQ